MSKLQSPAQSIVVVSGKRTPFGSFGGGLKDVGATQLAVAAGKAVLEHSGVSAKDVDHVVLGNVVQSGSDAAYVPRHVGLHLGVPVENGALGLNRLCGSGFQAWITAAEMILTGEANVVLAGGVEQMSQIPYVLRGARFEGFRMGQAPLEDAMTGALTDAYAGIPMAITAENLAEKYSISRDACEDYSLLTQKRCADATAQGAFATEIAPVTVTTRKGSITIDKDEHPKPGIPLEKLKAMKPMFKEGGTVTAATASGIVDGAAMSLLMTEEEAAKRGLKPMARMISWASVGCDPKIMGIGPAGAIRKALAKAGLELKDMDLVEVNEAFAAQYLAVEKELGLDREKTNVNGGAIAIGHPLAASGTRIMNHLAYELQRRAAAGKPARYAVGSACIGGGQGIAIVIENCAVERFAALKK
ncbi:MAG: acetyl-CoA C-acetyltransferase [Bdellovibrionales bacterium]|jgi:acetyl-CoA C-acetyltransferase/acetyl-CoA acyltransferase 2|nr:acetyl-CoA C-acetyltransferase [Bdellovibrionales bacterium]